MKGMVVLQAVRSYTPLMTLFVGALLATRAPGEGAGLAAGLAAALVAAVHMLTFGAAAARAAAPAWALRTLVSLGLVLALSAVLAPQLMFAAQIGEAGLFLSSGAGANLLLAALAGRAPTLRDEPW